jgi:hypothetical protein
MEINEIIQAIKDNKGNDEVRGLVVSLFKELAGSDTTAKSWLDSEKDKYHAKATETYKSNGNFEKDFEKYALEKGLMKDPANAKVEALEKKLADMEKESARKEATVKFMGKLKDKSIDIPNELLSKLISDDEAEMDKVISLLEARDNNIKKSVNADFLKTNKADPGKGETPTPKNYTKAEFLKLSYNERSQMISTEPEKYKTIMESEK